MKVIKKDGEIESVRLRSQSDSGVSVYMICSLHFFLLPSCFIPFEPEKEKIRTKLSFVWTYKKLQNQHLENSTGLFYVNLLGPYRPTTYILMYMRLLTTRE